MLNVVYESILLIVFNYFNNINAEIIKVNVK